MQKMSVSKVKRGTPLNARRQSQGGRGRFPIYVLTGFLGSGKTTALNFLAKQSEFVRTLVLINEFGEIGLDHDLVTFSGDELAVQMASGCVCCTIRGDLVKTLHDAPGRFSRGGVPWFDRVVIETTGLADPAPILHTLMNEPTLVSRYRLQGVISTVDAVNGENSLDRHSEAAKQVAVADRLLLTKLDLAEESRLLTLTNRLRALNPAAPHYPAHNGAFDLDGLLSQGPYEPSSKVSDVLEWLRDEAYEGSSSPSSNAHHTYHNIDHGHHHDLNRHDDEIRATCITLEEPVSGKAVDAWLEALLRWRGEDLLRVKGIIHVAELDAPMIIHGVQHIFHPPFVLPEWPSEDRRTRIVFIARNIEEETLRETLEVFRSAAGLLDTPSANF